jgi:hypothetical protein
MTSDKRLRARSLAEAWPEEFEFVQRAEIREKLLARAAQGSQPIAAITDELLGAFPSIATDMSQRRRFGLYIAAVLRDEGYVVRRSNVRMRNKLFTSGAVFRREELSVPTDLIRRIVASLTTDEAEHALDLLISRFPNLRSRARR